MMVTFSMFLGISSIEKYHGTFRTIHVVDVFVLSISMVTQFTKHDV